MFFLVINSYIHPFYFFSKFSICPYSSNDLLQFFDFYSFSQLDVLVTEKLFSPIKGLNGIIARLDTSVTDLKEKITEKLIELNLVPRDFSSKKIRLREKNPGNAGKILKNGTTLSENSIYSVYDGKNFCIQILNEEEIFDYFFPGEANEVNIEKNTKYGEECSEEYLERSSSSRIFNSENYINYSSNDFCRNNNIRNNAHDCGNNIFNNINNNNNDNNNKNNNNNNYDNNYCYTDLNNLSNNNYDYVMNENVNEKSIHSYNNNKNPSGLFNRNNNNNNNDYKNNRDDDKNNNYHNNNHNNSKNSDDNNNDNMIDNNNQINTNIIINNNMTDSNIIKNKNDCNFNENILSSVVLQVQIWNRRTFSLGTRHEILLHQNMTIKNITKKLSILFKIPLSYLRILFVPSTTEINLFELPLKCPTKYSTRAWFDGLLENQKLSDLCEMKVCDGDLLLLQNINDPLRELTEREKLSVEMINMKYNYYSSTVTSMNNNNSFNNSNNNSVNNSSNNLNNHLYNSSYNNIYHNGNNNNVSKSNISSSNNSTHNISSNNSFEFTTFNSTVQYNVKNKKRENGVHIKTHKERMLDKNKNKNDDKNKKDNTDNEVKNNNNNNNNSNSNNNDDDDESLSSTVASTNTSLSQIIILKNSNEKKNSVEPDMNPEICLKVEEYSLGPKEPSLGSEEDVSKLGYDIFSDLN